MFKDVRMNEDAPVVTRLRAAGMVLLGTTNQPELGLACVLCSAAARQRCAAAHRVRSRRYETDNNVYGRTNNPHALDRVAGGSSGGEVRVPHLQSGVS